MNNDKFYPVPLPMLLKLILKQLNEKNQVLGIPRKLFYKPQFFEPFKSTRFGQLLETPIGVAAGPHTQMTQNIVAAWLTGARYIELKTIQTLDELEVSKPCIDMQDEGYNCEWSQELKIQESYNQYLDAWIIIHILKHKLGIGDFNNPGVIFNMSVGYNMEGIMKENVQWFFTKMANASDELKQKIASIEDIYPAVKDLGIGSKISDNITLSTMHGCPPDEIEKIGQYLLNDKKLHTAIKLNPTLIGKDMLKDILRRSGFETNVPDIAFEHDLKYNDAVSIIENLQKTAKENKLRLSIKLTNTLESINHKDIFSTNEEMMYMSGRALHPISINLAAKLQNDFNGELDITFSGGVNAFNIADVMSCGLSPVTVCSDLLKPGGYARLNQYIELLRLRFEDYRANSIEDFIIKKSRLGSKVVSECGMKNLRLYAERVLSSSDYKRTALHNPSIKTNRPLGYFDCIFAPCEETCPTNQDIPTYNYFTSNGDICRAGEVILQTNPLPLTTGMICDHICQTKCTRINYDGAVLIREVKRYVAETAISCQSSKPQDPRQNPTPKKVAIIGSGPSGLSCAYFLVLAGFRVDIYESEPRPGGMITGVIPPFRLTNDAIGDDVERIKSLGVRIKYGVEVDKTLFETLRKETDYIYIAAGAQKSAKLKIDGIDAIGVVDPLKLLKDVKRGKTVEYGKHIAIIGGGNTAMDVARTAYRLVGEEGKVTIIYRRTIKEMPADMGEIRAVLEEGVDIKELTLPERIFSKNGKVTALLCSRMELGDKDESGRRAPVKIQESEFEIEVDTIIPAVGQELAYDFGCNDLITSKPGAFETSIPNVFIGGDAMRGASTAINAIGDGRKVAQKIIDREGIEFLTKPFNFREPMDYVWHMTKRSGKVNPVKVSESSLDNRKNFDLVTQTLTEDEVIEEASRCMLCDEFCSICTTVCPNLANYTYEISPLRFTVQLVSRKEDGSIEIKPNGVFEVKQQYQILNIGNFCNECGNCNTFCPTSGAPYKVKPKIYLTQSSFDTVSEGYYLERKIEENVLHFKQNGINNLLIKRKNEYEFSGDGAVIIFPLDDMRIIKCSFSNNTVNQISTAKAIEMSIVMNGVEELQMDFK